MEAARRPIASIAQVNGLQGSLDSTYRSLFARKMPSVLKVADLYQDGHETYGSADTSDYIFGMQSMKFTSANNVRINSDKVVSLDLTDAWVEIACKVDSAAVAELQLLVDLSANWSKSALLNLTYTPGEWRRMRAHVSSFSLSNAVLSDFANARVFRVRVRSTAGNTVNAWFNRIAYFTPTHTPVVTWVFDDGHITNYTHGMRALESRGVHATFYTIPGWWGGTNRMTVAHLKDVIERGHDVSSHSYNHVDLRTLTDDELRVELASARQALLDIGAGRAAFQMAMPYGYFNYSQLPVFAEFCETSRMVGGTPQALPPLAPTLLTCSQITAATEQSAINGLIDTAIARKGWLILMAHDIAESGAAGGTINRAIVEDSIDYARSAGALVLSVTETLDQL